jgi:hypothetical protein
MAKVGRFVTDPKAGSYCQITLDSGEKIVVNHDKQHLTIEHSRMFGFASDQLFACDLATPTGQAVVTILTRQARPDSADATPLGGLVNFVKTCGTAADVKARCSGLLSAA